MRLELSLVDECWELVLKLNPIDWFDYHINDIPEKLEIGRNYVNNERRIIHSLREK